MSPFHHTALAAAPALAAAFIRGPSSAGYFFIGAVLLDADHYLFYAVKFRDTGFRRCLRFYDAVKHTPKAAFCVLHTVEFLALTLAAAAWFKSPALLFFWLGAVFHLSLDLLEGVVYKRVGHRWWSCVHWLLKRRT
jgi:hypothetical protein